MIKLEDALAYNPETGDITWKVRSGPATPGKVAGCVTGHGYRYIAYRRKWYRAHRLAWYLHYGEWPSAEIDHINHCKTDNRLANLRQATSSQNKWNARKSTKNKSGIKGVFWSKRDSKWRVAIAGNKRSYHVGFFEDIREAEQAYNDAAKRLHGQFACVG